jgi:hypothetical protein
LFIIIVELEFKHSSLQFFSRIKSPLKNRKNSKEELKIKRLLLRKKIYKIGEEESKRGIENNKQRIVESNC